MNLLLLHPHELAPDGTAVLTDRRLAHARDVLRVGEGDTVRVGVKFGAVGTAEILASSPTALTLRCSLFEPPPPRPGIDLVLAVPRPKALRRVIPAVASLGVDRLVLLNATKVEKSYFDAKVLTAEALDALAELGLEQARDTVPPRIEVRPRFRPFVEDELDAFFPQGALRLVPDPSATEVARAMPADARLVIAVGPDGGWTPFELDLLARRGFMPVQLGPRVLRGEVAVPAVIGALRPTLAQGAGGAARPTAR
ncbi:MAG: 16S rRNA (uracil(1498)-N(3))-methyltransferase [Myxococcaceae bacterium]|nr:16S rRNA (uracil(1498)-N(3))-methyltransferase [Myxococcaceae bacterium]MCA3012426.1 16S rRNA (uracil(1498)-N(3))-methyltransferase [Myxococcaceae bacterium]